MAAEFVVDAGLTAIVLNYRNKLLIGDQILPRVRVGTKAFEYTTMLASQNITLIDTNVGRRSKPNEIDMTGQSATAKCEDQALDAPVPYNDIEEYNSGVARGLVAPRDIDGAKVEQVQNVIDLRREKRVADTVYTAASYPAGNKVTLSGTSQWSDYTNSDPLTAMLTALDAMYWRPNSLVMGNDVWAKLRVHPKLSAALYPQGGNASVATAPIQDTSGLAAVLGLQNVYIGQSFLNTAKPGQAISNARVWGKHALFFTKDDSIRTTDGGITLGITAQFGERVSGRIMDPDMGMRGGYRVRAGECLKEVLVAPDTAYLFTNAVA
jgi:hypothetical protein